MLELSDLSDLPELTSDYTNGDIDWMIAYSVDADPTAEVLAEVDNAELAVEELARDGHTSRKCLRCGGHLSLERIGGSYQVRCGQEGRVILTSRGL